MTITRVKTVLLLWCRSSDCNAEQMDICREREQTGSCGLCGVSGSFTYFTNCIEGGVGRMNDSVALHDGNVGLDNLQLQTTTMTNNRQQHGGKNTVSDQGQLNERRNKKKKKRMEEKNRRNETER